MKVEVIVRSQYYDGQEHPRGAVLEMTPEEFATLSALRRVREVKGRKVGAGGSYSTRRLTAEG